MKILKKLGLIILITISSVILLIYILTMPRDTSVITKNIEVSKGVTIHITREHSQKRYYGHPHGFGFGGGDFRSSIEFTHKNIHYFHKTIFIPIVIRFHKNNFYLVYYDRETNPRNSYYRFYKSNKEHEFEEIEAVDFPKHIAIQNWFWKSKNQSEKVLLEPEKIVGTTTSHLWYLIEGKPKISNYEENIEFVTNYMNKYMNTNYKK